MSHFKRGVRGSALSAVKSVCTSDSNSSICDAQGGAALSFAWKLLIWPQMVALHIPHSADWSRNFCIFHETYASCKRSSSITEGVGGGVILQDKIGKSAVARGKYTSFSSLVVLKL